MQNPLLNPSGKEDAFEQSVRPSSLEEFIGQQKAITNLSVFIKAAKQRGDALDHVILSGPPGLGKTTLSYIIAQEMGVNIRPTTGPVLEKPGDLAGMLTNLEQGDVLFIDEIHRLNVSVEEVLYPAMEDFGLDLMVGEGPSARSLRIELQPFTLVGATTRLGLLTNPLRDRFGIPIHLEFYTTEDLVKIIERSSKLLNAKIDILGAKEIAKRSRGTPRVAGRLLRRVIDFAQVEGDGSVSLEIAKSSLTKLGVDTLGLDSSDRKYLLQLAENYQGGPVGVETICAALSESRDAIEDVIEPYLLQVGLVQRTPRGRVLSKSAWEHLGIEMPMTKTSNQENQGNFFDK